MRVKNAFGVDPERANADVFERRDHDVGVRVELPCDNEYEGIGLVDTACNPSPLWRRALFRPTLTSDVVRPGRPQHWPGDGPSKTQRASCFQRHENPERGDQIGAPARGAHTTNGSSYPG